MKIQPIQAALGAELMRRAKALEQLEGLGSVTFIVNLDRNTGAVTGVTFRVEAR